MSKYVVEKNFSGLEGTKLFEPEVNHLASEYFVEHYEEILKRARGISDVDPFKVPDLVQDVMLSILKSESNGDGYDVDRSDEGSIISVAEFVYGRLKRYAQNQKYKTVGSERKTHKKRNGEDVVAYTSFDVVYASADAGADQEDMDATQRAFANASSYDAEIENIEETLSLRSNIEFCLNFNDVVGFDFLNMFKNIEAFSGEFDTNIFTKLRNQLSVHDELSDALRGVLSFACANPATFNSVISEF